MPVFVVDQDFYHSSHDPQEVLLAQFSLYVHKGGPKPDLFHFLLYQNLTQINEITWYADLIK